MEIGTCEAEASEQWDYVLVAHPRTQRDPWQVRQQQFLQELERKGFRTKRIQDQKRVFFGIRADNSIFDLYRTLLLEPEGPTPNAELAALTPVPVAMRIRIVDFVVMKTKTSAGETFEDLVKDGVFEARFPLHKGEGYLKKTWAGWRHMFRKQPVDEIRNYFGEKVALYFAWLGWYNYMLVPAALTGLLVFLSGFSLFDASQIRWAAAVAGRGGPGWALLPGGAGPSLIPAPSARRSVRPTTSSCVPSATTAAGTSGSRKPALSPRFVTSGSTPGPVEDGHSAPTRRWGGQGLEPCRAAQFPHRADGEAQPQPNHPPPRLTRHLPSLPVSSPAHPSPPQLTHLFDNDGTVVFAIFMALWATVFLEIWKRQRACVVLHWDLYMWDEDQEEMALELINCPDYKLQPYQHSYLRSTVILILSLIMICLMIGMAHILVVYRVLASALFSSSALLFLEDQVTTAVVVTGALVHYVTISIMTKINKRVALKLCDFEMPRTFSERESKFTIRFFTLQFFTHFSSLIYIAFILGRINGHPGKSTRLAGLWKLEECHASGCMMDLFVQMAIIMGLKQTLSNCGEYLVPWVTHKFRSLRASEARHLPRDPELRDWRRNYLLNSVNIFSLFDEFMEMMIQYGFTTIFVAAFPLAPLLALFSNLVEIRLDAIKMVWLQRRLVPRKAKDIGTWLQVLETIGVLAVIANGMIIAFTSEFIPRVVYKYRYSPCLKEANSTVDCLKGYVNHSLSVFHTKDFQDPDRIEGSENVTLCRYRDYRNPPDYNFSEQFWFLLAIRLAFVILFEHVALCIKLIAAWFVPDVPQSVKNKVLECQEHRCVGPEPV
uniref:Anoctamin n=1 Tax=Rhinopithecus bieti TaxID=61621 RepID=A0A2K6L043_RHIBE